MASAPADESVEFSESDIWGEDSSLTEEEVLAYSSPGRQSLSLDVPPMKMSESEDESGLRHTLSSSPGSMIAAVEDSERLEISDIRNQSSIRRSINIPAQAPGETDRRRSLGGRDGSEAPPRKLARNLSLFPTAVEDEERVENGCEAFRAYVAHSLPNRGEYLKLDSVLEGHGRKLKGLDALRFRTTVLTQTGFLEPPDTGLAKKRSMHGI